MSRQSIVTVAPAADIFVACNAIALHALDVARRTDPELTVLGSVNDLLIRWFRDGMPEDLETGLPPERAKAALDAIRSDMELWREVYDVAYFARGARVIAFE